MHVSRSPSSGFLTFRNIPPVAVTKSRDPDVEFMELDPEKMSRTTVVMMSRLSESRDDVLLCRGRRGSGGRSRLVSDVPKSGGREIIMSLFLPALLHVFLALLPQKFCFFCVLDGIMVFIFLQVADRHKVS